MEYVYNKPMRVNDLSCIGFEFSINANEDGLEKLKANFTFKFPAKTGYFYHVPTYSPVNTINPAIWDTQTRRGTYSFFNCVILCFKSPFLIIWIAHVSNLSFSFSQPHLNHFGY